ncbi:MAG: DUF2236 domain-containing protein [Acidimicrobiia bacterium]|nr:DUF2236 domain-containing protein [Acidimicrobiia bacterium]
MITSLTSSAASLATTSAAAAIDTVRGRLALGVRQLVVGDNPPVRDLDGPLEGDLGIFGPDSITWQIHADAAVFVGGLRALFLQTMHPAAMAGVAEHSAYRSDPLGRLARTANYVGVTTYGTVPEATRMVGAVRTVHERVVGRTPDGEPYAANDPHLLTFVHHTLVDSLLRAHQRYGATALTQREADTYVAEMAVLADLFEAEPAATSVAELRAWFSDEQPVLRGTSQARSAARFLLTPPLPIAARPSYGVIAAAAVGLLPASVRRSLWLPTVPFADPLVVRPATGVLLHALRWVMAGLPEAATDHEGGDATEVDAEAA